MTNYYTFRKRNENGGWNIQNIMFLPMSGKFSIYSDYYKDNVYNSMTFNSYDEAVNFLLENGFDYYC